MEDNCFTICVGFCHKTTWISHRYTYVPSLLNLPPTPHPSPPLQLVTEHWVELPASYNKFPLTICFTHDGWMASPTQWTWVWVNSESWWWTGRPGVLWFMGLQRVRHDRATELNWTECICLNATLSTCPSLSFSCYLHKSVLYVSVSMRPANRFISTTSLHSIYLH